MTFPTHTAISISALESMEKMVNQLQAERNALYEAIVNVSTSDDAQSQRAAMDDAILLALGMEP